jgi:Protein of unknown function (DUF3089)
MHVHRRQARRYDWVVQSIATVLVGAAVVAGCASENDTASTPDPVVGMGAPSAARSQVSARYGEDDAWLCRGDTPECGARATRTLTRPDGSTATFRAPDPAADCFVVSFPSELVPVGEVEPLATARALSPLCRVHLPIVRETATVADTGSVTDYDMDPLVPFGDVLDAFQEFVFNRSHERPIVLVSPSTAGSGLATTVLDQIDARPEWRHRLVAAVIPGRTLGSAGEPLPLCQDLAQVECVIPAPVSPTGVAPPLPGVPDGWAGACVNPADFLGRPAFLPDWMVAESAENADCDVLALIAAKLQAVGELPDDPAFRS